MCDGARINRARHAEESDGEVGVVNVKVERCSAGTLLAVSPVADCVLGTRGLTSQGQAEELAAAIVANKLSQRHVFRPKTDAVPDLRHDSGPICGSNDAVGSGEAGRKRFLAK